MNELFDFFGTIRLKADDLYKGLDKVTKDAKTTADGIGKKFKNVGTNINKTLQGVATGLSGSLSAVSTFATKAGNELTNKITKPALAAGSALMALTLGKGWSRLISIDDARAKLIGLGHDGQAVKEIMDNALNAVRGTAHGMGEAAVTAAGAVAAGIPAGKELERYLTIVGDAAAIAGIKMDEMGSIINKVTTSGIAQAEELNQLADRGIPIFQWLADEMGVTAQEVKKLASDGKVSSEIFLNAIENNIGGAAKKMGQESFRAAVENIGASIGRIGANILNSNGKVKGVFDQIKPLLAEILDGMGALEEKAKVWGDLLANQVMNLIAKFREFQTYWANLSSGQRYQIKETIKSVALLLVALGPVLKIIGSIAAVGATATKGMNALSKFFGKAAASAAAATGKFATFQGAFMSSMGVLSTIGSIGLGVGAFGGILAVLGLVQEQFGDQLDSFFHMAETQGDGIIRGYVSGITKRLPELINQGTTLVTNFLGAVAANLPAVIQGGAQILSSLITGVADNLPRIIEVALEIVAQLIIGIIGAIPDLIAAGGSLIMGLVTGLVENLPVLWEKLNEIVAEIQRVISEAIDPIIAKYQEWADKHPILSDAFEGLLVGIGLLVGGFTIFKVAAGIAAGAAGIFTWVVGGITTALGLVSGPIGWIVLAFLGLVATLYVVWQNWDKITEWIAEKFEAVTARVKQSIEEWKELIDGFKTWQQENLQSLEVKYEPYMEEIEGADVKAGGFWSNLFGGNKEKVAVPAPAVDTSAIDELVTQVRTKITAAMLEMDQLGRDYSAKLIDGIVAGITTNLSKVTLNLEIMQTKIAEIFTKGTDKVNTETNKGLAKLEPTYRDSINKAYNVVRETMPKIIEAFRSAISGVTAAGAETGRGFYNGLNSQRGRIISLAQSIARSVDSTMRDALDINSPSDLAEETSGFYGEGIVLGLIKSVQAVKNAAQYVANAMVQTPNPQNVTIQSASTSQAVQTNNELLRLVSKLVDITERESNKEKDVILDGKKVSAGLHDPLNNYSKARENLKLRQKGAWA